MKQVMVLMTSAAIAATITAALPAATAYAQTPCPEGRLASGAGVNPTLAQVMRQSTIIATQPKISFTAPLNLPFQDAYYPTLPQRYEYTRLFGYPPTRPGGLNPSNPVTMP